VRCFNHCHCLEESRPAPMLLLDFDACGHHFHGRNGKLRISLALYLESYKGIAKPAWNRT
jgi:hypothetical protein